MLHHDREVTGSPVYRVIDCNHTRYTDWAQVMKLWHLVIQVGGHGPYTVEKERERERGSE